MIVLMRWSTVKGLIRRARVAEDRARTAEHQLRDLDLRYAELAALCYRSGIISDQGGPLRRNAETMAPTIWHAVHHASPATNAVSAT